ncbi:DUF2812 domain-containing protein [Chloroflexota bacterium]
MSENTIRKFKWFWPWQDEQEEAWLRRMSQQGWHLLSVGLAGIYRFQADEPCDCVYRLDYQTYKKKDEQDYLQLFSDAGWEHIGYMSNWHYFRKEVREGEAPDIFTDVESKVAKYKKVLTHLAFFAVIIIVVLSRNIWFEYPYSWWFVVRAIYLFLTASLVYSIIKLLLRIRHLRRL